MEQEKTNSICKFPEGRYQPGLIENQEAVEFSNTSVIGNNKSALTFKNPDPNKMFIGNKRFDQHLLDLGLGWVLSFKEFIKSLDFTAFIEKYPGGGNSPYHPALMFGLITFGIMKGVRSLRNLEELAKDSIACMWICNGIMPDFTTIGRFINLHKEILTDEFFEEITSKILEIVDSSVASLAGDGTVIQAAASSYKSLKLEAARLAAEKAEKESDDSPDDEKLQKKAELAKQVAEIAEKRAQKRRKKGDDPKRTRVSPTEPEAAIQPLKNKSYAPSYVTSIITTKERIIVGKNVDPTNQMGQASSG